MWLSALAPANTAADATRAVKRDLEEYILRGEVVWLWELRRRLVLAIVLYHVSIYTFDEEATLEYFSGQSTVNGMSDRRQD